jgi:2-oxoglutarate ferredoxin oxidoreductase subunit delta
MVAAFTRQPVNLKEAVIPVGQIYIIPERCKGCKFCIDFCPKDVLVESKEMNAKGYHYPVVAEGKDGLCIQCEFCSLFCPEFAIYTEEQLKEETEKKEETVAAS